MNLQEQIHRMKQMMGLVTETRQGMFNWLKEKLPNTPEYVIRDWVYKMIKQSDDVNTYEGITEWIDEWVKDIEWDYQKDFPISMDIFTDKTKKELESRIQGEVRHDVDKDTERHETQKELLQSKGISEEPIILFKNRDGKYELGEGWHRTTQTFIQFPDGFIQPNVYIGLNAKWLDNMNLQEQIHRMKQMMGLLTEVTNPYSVNWIPPTEEYFTQELDELLGNEMRFSKDEFFHPQNYDMMYSLFPHTFKMIAEHSKGDDIESEQEMKEVLVGKEIYELMDDWGEFRHVLMGDKESKMEAFNLFRMGSMEHWDDEKINTTFYMGNFGENFPDMFKDTTSSGLLKQMKDGEGETPDHFKGYSKNIENFRNDRNLELPPPFVMSLPSGGREGNVYTLIGGHKRSTVARQLNVPVDVWFIDLTKNKK